MAVRIGKSTIIFQNKPSIIGYGSVVGKKEFEGPLGKEFDAHDTDSRFGEESFEKATVRGKAMKNNSIQEGMRVMIAGFGVGLSWASTILKF